ncbi:MAG TPA: sigma-70 family RNA polymerase sigma factor [Thermoanaerobaculia bacterium]|nr:sigma-70 family RNA polymerase sigma factor [Thermoanaerobaculia bacterium]
MSERDPTPERELIERVLEGDPSAFEVIVRRHQKRIFRVAWAILRDESEADAVTQDTFVQAYLHLKGFAGRSGLETWLTRIAINRSRDALRGRRRIRLTGWTGGEEDGGREWPQPVDPRPDAEREVMGRELQDAIDRAVDRLSIQQRLVFRMRHYEDRSLEEIASILGLRAGTVRAHLFRAIHKVRRELSGWFPSRKPAEGERR